MNWLGLDIGGANLKASDGFGWWRIEPFALWRNPEKLSDAIHALIRQAPHAERLAVTMTGELCDCYRRKSEGVSHILGAVQNAANEVPVVVYCVNGRFVSADTASQNWKHAAASNWHALASFACRFVGNGNGLLIDMGSTTADIVPLVEGRPKTHGHTDTERLCAVEMLYTGVGRTPICAVTTTLPWRGGLCPVAAELFATTADAYVLLDELPEQPDATWTADGRPLTREYARERMARMICADPTEIDLKEAIAMARHVRQCQFETLEQSIRKAIARESRPYETIIVSGSGEFIARAIARQIFGERTIVSLSEQLGAVASSCAPAHAVAVLAREGKPHE